MSGDFWEEFLKSTVEPEIVDWGPDVGKEVWPMYETERAIYMVLNVELAVSSIVAVKTLCQHSELLEYCVLNGLVVHEIKMSTRPTIGIRGRIVVGHKVSVNGREYTRQASEPEWLVADLIGLSGEPRQVPRYTLTIK